MLVKAMILKRQRYRHCILLYLNDSFLPFLEPTFNSNLNAFDWSVDVSDDLINLTAAFLSLNKHMVSGVTTRNGQAMALGTAGALAVWKSE